MQWTCQDCGNEHTTSTVRCKDCGSWAVLDEDDASESSPADASSTRPESDLNSSPDVNPDGTINESEKAARVVTPSTQTRSGSALRGGYYKIKAVVKAPFHILWMYKAAIAAFLLVFGLAFLGLLSL